MPQIKFGNKQLHNPTPSHFDRNVKIFVGISGLFLAWMPTNNIVPHHVQDIITPIINLTNSIALFLLPFFGVQTTQKMIPKEQVTEMEVVPKNTS